MLLLCLPGLVAAQEPAAVTRSKVEAAFLRNFARYVTWPPRSFANERTPWSVCILGHDPFEGELEATFQGRMEHGRPFEVFRANSLDRLPACHIVFVGYQDVARRRAVLDELKLLPTLTVGHAPEFLQEGGIIRLAVGERVEMSVNLDRARAASLLIPAKMLEVSREVVENGAVKRWK
ncbi:YfiR family protein [Aquabacterium sp.]|uniref:YfiR family protein n=1 Tax=Aquabacterium sp. TaxID=1872578 RepID=UPI002BA3E764|nr:YfiR family protein [Aquabacterium sp.]HSW08896.1 YfiR family protein [Aquabacterium sp.]